MGRFSLISEADVQSNGIGSYLTNSRIINAEANMPIEGGYQLGWDSYCFYTQQESGFILNRAERLNRSRTDVPAAVVSRIVTRGVSGCTVVIIKIDNKLCFMHLDKPCAVQETANLHITNEFLNAVDIRGTSKILIVFSYIETETGAGINLSNAVESCITHRFNVPETNILRIRRCTVAQHNNGQNITCHVEIGTAFDGSNVIVYGDVYKALTGKFINYFEIPLDANTGFTERSILYNSESDDGCYDCGCGCGGCVVI